MNPSQLGGKNVAPSAFPGSPQTEAGRAGGPAFAKALRAEAEASVSESKSLDKETLRELLKKTADLVGTVNVDRHLKYEVIDEAGLVQIQVIDSHDGNVVRKIPADEIVKLVERIHETLSDRLDVTA